MPSDSYRKESFKPFHTEKLSKVGPRSQLTRPRNLPPYSGPLSAQDAADSARLGLVLCVVRVKTEFEFEFAASLSPISGQVRMLIDRRVSGFSK
jgi:hypothetical protein